MTASELAYHAIADVFPLLDGKPLNDLIVDIRRHGLREPIWLYEGRILDGRNRYRACRVAGVEPTFADYDGDDPVGFVVSLNLHRRHLSESQRAVCAGKAANLKVGNPNWTNSSNCGITTKQAAEKFNIGTTAVKSAKQVLKNGIPDLADKVMAGEVRVSTAADIATQTPEQQAAILARESPKAILEAARAIRSENARARQAENERIRQQALATPPPDGQYRCIVMDPPWPMTKIERDVRPNQVCEVDYPVMTVDEIRAIEPPAAELCHLYLWTTQRFLFNARLMLDDWGFRYLALMVWHKSGGFQPAGLPQYNCEFVLVGRKGSLDFNTTQDFPLCFDGQRREHSRKPDRFYDMVRRVSPGPRIDMFSRESRPGFDQHGAECHAFL